MQAQSCGMGLPPGIHMGRFKQQPNYTEAAKYDTQFGMGIYRYYPAPLHEQSEYVQEVVADKRIKQRVENVKISFNRADITPQGLLKSAMARYPTGDLTRNGNETQISMWQTPLMACLDGCVDSDMVMGTDMFLICFLAEQLKDILSVFDEWKLHNGELHNDHRCESSLRHYICSIENVSVDKRSRLEERINSMFAKWVLSTSLGAWTDSWMEKYLMLRPACALFENRDKIKMLLEMLARKQQCSTCVPLTALDIEQIADRWGIGHTPLEQSAFQEIVCTIERIQNDTGAAGPVCHLEWMRHSIKPLQFWAVCCVQQRLLDMYVSHAEGNADDQHGLECLLLDIDCLPFAFHEWLVKEEQLGTNMQEYAQSLYRELAEGPFNYELADEFDMSMFEVTKWQSVRRDPGFYLPICRGLGKRQWQKVLQSGKGRCDKCRQLNNTWENDNNQHIMSRMCTARECPCDPAQTYTRHLLPCSLPTAVWY